MMRTTRYLLAALALAGVVATGCGSSNSSPEDGGTDGPVTKADTGKPTTDSGPTKDTGTTKDTGPSKDAPVSMDSPVVSMDAPMAVDTGVDSGHDSGIDAGACDFNAFVIMLYKQSSNSTPSTNLGQMCNDTHTLITAAEL
jgi:hypothetical protein